MIDRAVPHVLQQAGLAHEVIDFFPYGYDERQYCSPGFNLPVGCLMRARHGQFPEYHTSADNLQFVQPAALATSLAVCATVLATLDGNARYRNLLPKGEPQLGKRGLYRPLVASSMPARGRWPCCGCSITPMVSTPCWTSLSAPTCRSSSCAKPRMLCWRMRSG